MCWSSRAHHLSGALADFQQNLCNTSNLKVEHELCFWCFLFPSMDALAQSYHWDPWAFQPIVCHVVCAASLHDSTSCHSTFSHQEGKPQVAMIWPWLQGNVQPEPFCEAPGSALLGRGFGSWSTPLGREALQFQLWFGLGHQQFGRSHQQVQRQHRLFTECQGGGHLFLKMIFFETSSLQVLLIPHIWIS